MRDPQKLIDDIEGFLARSDQTLTNEVRAMVEEYNELCWMTESRLRRCEDYLRRGLVGEAIHLAEVEPAILDLVAALNFPGRPSWDEVLTMYGLPVPPGVNLPRAAALNQAYEHHQFIEPLLKEYRRLCLTHASLPQRVTVLRQLSQTDPTNSSWTDDLIACEAPALREMQQTAKISRQDPVALATLAQQLQSNSWSNPDAQTLLQQVREELTVVRAQQARNSLKNIGRELELAIRRDDSASAMRNYQALYEIWQGAELPPEDPTSQLLNRTALWIQEAQKRAQQATEVERQAAAFRALLKSGQPDERAVEDSYTRLAASGMPVPVDVKHLYREVMGRFERERDAKARRWDRLLNTALLLVALPVALAVLVVMGVVVYRILQNP